MCLVKQFMVSNCVPGRQAFIAIFPTTPQFAMLLKSQFHSCISEKVTARTISKKHKPRPRWEDLLRICSALEISILCLTIGYNGNKEMY